MPGLHDAEVTVIQRRELGLLEHLAGGDHRCVDEPEREVSVAIDELTGADQPA
jgi:hypothetical protein